MAIGYRLPAGGLPSAAKALLIPENIRAGVHIKGGGVDVVGIFPAVIQETKTVTVSVRASSGAGGTTAVTFDRTYLIPPAVAITSVGGTYASQFNHRVISISSTGCVLSWGYDSSGSGNTFTNSVNLYITGAVG